MNYISTRGNYKKVSSAEAIKTGMVPEGGLFVPEKFPVINEKDIASMENMSYQEIAEKVFSLYLTDFTQDEIKKCVNGAYNTKNFDTKDIAPVVKLDEKNYILELWHGPTAAFKDMALQIMPYFLTVSKEKLNDKNETVILVATSGDTGKAALEGFKNIKGIKIAVFYPVEGVSEVQKLQMNTTDGNNTVVMAVKGNFDDCQTAVKNIFSNKELKETLFKKGIEFSSANSINWGRLLPQIVYYFHAYATMVRNEEVKYGDEVDFCVPTGNFGNILAGYYAKKMGLPVGRLVCASNSNNVLTDFFITGKYNRKRHFHKTMSPSMDIIISSNLERFLHDISGGNGEAIVGFYRDLGISGSFTVSDEIKSEMDNLIVAGYCSEEDTEKTIKDVYDETGYVLDTHTAVAVKVANDYNRGRKMVIDSTASPYKFSNSVVKSITGSEFEDEFDAVNEIANISKFPIHVAVQGLKDKEVLHKKVVDKSELEKAVKEMLNI